MMARESRAVSRMGNAIVRIHGTSDRARTEEAATKYIKRVNALKRRMQMEVKGDVLQNGRPHR